jgi:hypothetical protein
MQKAERFRVFLVGEHRGEMNLIGVPILGFDIDCVVWEGVEVGFDVSPVFDVIYIVR